MVGTPKSSGCDNCRKRKKKCGEERPECLACVAAGWKCPGFTKRWKFVDESQQLLTQHKKNRYTVEESTPPLIPRKNYELAKFHVNVFHHLTSQNDMNMAILKYALTDPQSRVVFPLESLGGFFKFIPSRLGTNLALDAAVSCLCTIFTETRTKNTPGSAFSVNQYIKSLSALRICLEEPCLSSDSETLCASIILQVCELSISTDNGRWNQLSRGTKLLVENRGPETFVSPFERAMLESQRAFFIMQDVNTEKRTFLSLPQWRVFFQNALPSYVGQGPSSLNLRSSLCNLLVEVPGLFSEASRLSCLDSSALNNETELESQRKAFICRATATAYNMQTWYTVSLEPLLRNSRPKLDDLMQSNHEYSVSNISAGITDDYPELLLAVLDCVSNSVLTRLQMLILELVPFWSDQQDGLDLTTWSDGIRHHQATAQRAHAFVRRTSVVGAKLLEYGLQQIWSPAAFTALFGEGL